jgi:glycosyltransferase involved in cell wall biosynthesis
MKKIAIITPFLANGGLEKVAVVSAEGLCQYYDVTLVVLDSYQIDYEFSGHLIDLNVSIKERGNIKRLINVFKTIYKLRKLKKQSHFDLCISHGELANIPNVLSGGNNIVTIHGNRFDFITDFQGKIVNGFIKFLYSFRNVSKLVTVSRGIENSFIENSSINPEKIKTIYNPINLKEVENKKNIDLSEFKSLFSAKTITTMGRLTFAKGHWYLLRIFKNYLRTNQGHKLIILGDGELREKLIQLSQKLNLKTYTIWSGDTLDKEYDVYFLGFQSNPFKYVNASSLFIMTSLWEGFGNTIVEAMACGVPVISSNCKSGPREIINPSLLESIKLEEPNYDGFGVLMPIFENKFYDSSVPCSAKERLWAKTIASLVADVNSLIELTTKGNKRAKDFHVDKIISTWISVIDSALDND